MMMGTPGRLGITITGPLSARAGAVSREARQHHCNEHPPTTQHDRHPVLPPTDGILDEAGWYPGESPG